MAYMALYRKWRPLTFDDVVEQRHVVNTLKNSIKNNAISHAYLFCGTRGTGKTTLAKIFARAINCLDPQDGSPCNKCSNCKGILDGSIIDVIEIDAASNNGVDDVREIKEAVMYVPAVTRYKVYIIDEVHMLSTGAFNALLKTLEEPPANVVFILATTEPHKLPATILSRCQRFDFKRITLNGLAARLTEISQDCGVAFDQGAIHLIARLSEGGMRDAISLLDQCVTLGKTGITREDVAEISGLTAAETVDTLAKAIIEHDAQSALKAIKTAMDEGRDLQSLCSQLVDWFRNLMLVKTGGDALSLVEVTDEELTPVKTVTDSITMDRVLAIIRELSETDGRLKWSENQRILLEVTAIKLCAGISAASGNVSDDRISYLESKIEMLERRLASQPAAASPVINTEKPMAAPKPVPRNDDAPKAAPKAKSEAGIDPNAQFRQWPDVIEYIRLAGKMKVYAYLLDTSCIISGNTASVVVPGDDGLKKTVLSRNDSIEVIKDALKNVAGLELGVKIVDEKTISSAQANPDHDPDLERIKQFASQNNIPLNIQE